MALVSIPVVGRSCQLQVHVLDLERCRETEDDGPLEELARGLVVVASKDDEVVVEPIAAVSGQWVAGGLRICTTHRISKRVQACLALTEVKGRKDGMAWVVCQFEGPGGA